MLTQEELRIKRLTKTLKRRKYIHALKKNQEIMSRIFGKRLKEWRAGSELRKNQKRWHIHSWSRLAKKDGQGKYYTVGYICNKCGKKKKSWRYEIKKFLGLTSDKREKLQAA